MSMRRLSASHPGCVPTQLRAVSTTFYAPALDGPTGGRRPEFHSFAVRSNTVGEWVKPHRFHSNGLLRATALGVSVACEPGVSAAQLPAHASFAQGWL